MKRPFFFFAIALIILILAFRFFVKEDSFSPGHISYLLSESPRPVAIKGTVIDDPLSRYLYFKRAEIFVVRPVLIRSYDKWLPAYGNMRVTSYSEKGVKYGDEILFEAVLKIPFSHRASGKNTGSFDYRKYLERFGIYALATVSDKDPLIILGRGKGSALQDIAYGIKDVIKSNIKKLFGRPERYFLSAVLLGERQDIPKEWREIFSKTQTMHLVAISGLHVGIVAFIALFLAGLFGLPVNFRYLLTIFVLILYALMVGGRPSVVRAAVMAAVFLGAYLAKKDADIYNSLGLAASVILLYNPDQLFDYGFILSFTSVFFIVYMAPVFNRLFRIDKCKNIKHVGGGIYYFLTLFSASLAVWLGLLPLSVNFFNIISPVSAAVNVLAIPALFIIIAASLFSLMAYPVLPFLGDIFAESANFFIDALMSFLSSSSKLPFAYAEAGPQNIFAVFFYYAALFGIVKHYRSSLDNVISM